MQLLHRLTCVALLLASQVAWCAPPAEHQEASALHREKRHASALGHFLNLAEEGDARAARIVVFMYDHARLLYRAEWEPHEEDLHRWRRQSQQQQQRRTHDVRRASP